MFRPTGFSYIPPVVKNLIILNVLMLLATTILESKFQGISSYLSLHHFSSDQFQPFQLVTHFFMHAGFMHLFGNMLILFFLGSGVEQRMGPKVFLSFYFVCALGAAAVYLGYQTFHLHAMESLMTAHQNMPDVSYFVEFANKYIDYGALSEDGQAFISDAYLAESWNGYQVQRANHLMAEWIEFERNMPMLGASGAVYGVLLAAGLYFGNQWIVLLFPPIPLRIWWLVIFLGAGAFFNTFSAVPGDSVAHAAHLGGMIFGYLLIRVLKVT